MSLQFQSPVVVGQLHPEQKTQIVRNHVQGDFGFSSGKRYLHSVSHRRMVKMVRRTVFVRRRRTDEYGSLTLYRNTRVWRFSNNLRSVSIHTNITIKYFIMLTAMETFIALLVTYVCTIINTMNIVDCILK